MKKILSCLIVALLVIMALASCTISGGSNPTTTEPTAPAVDPMEQAKSFLYAMYKDESTTTPADIIRLNTISVGGVQYSVEWSVEVTQGEASDVVIEAGAQSYEVVVNVNEKTNVEVKYVLTAIISDAEGNTINLSFAEYTVPAFGVKGWADYIAAGEGDSVVVQGVVTAIFCKSQGASYNGMYLQDADGGYYIYSMANDVDPLVAGVKVGMTVQVAGLKTIYSGTHEVKEATVEIISEEISEVVVYDYTEIFQNASSLTDTALVEKQAQLVTIKGVTVLPQDADVSSGYYKFKMGELTTYVRISGSVCPIPKAEQDAFKALHGEKAGWTADVTGVISLYDGRFYLTPVDANAFDYKSAPECTHVPADEWQKDGTNHWKLCALCGLQAGAQEAHSPVGSACATCGYAPQTITLPEAIEIASAGAHNVYTADKYVINAIVKEVYNAQYGNMYVIDEAGNELTIYGSYSADGKDRYDAMSSKPVAGDIVVLFGALGNYNGTPQMKNAWILSFETPAGGCSHEPAADWSNNASKHWHVCAKCGEKLDGEAYHNYANGSSCADCGFAAIAATLPEAIALGAAQEHNVYTTNSYIVSGAIVEIANAQYGNVYIQDAEGNKLYIYGLYTANGATRFDKMDPQPAVGDIITVIGILGQYNGTVQMKNGSMVACQAPSQEHTHAPEADYSYDDDNHWNACSGCDEQLNKAAHDFSNGDCVCGKEAPVVGPTYTSIPDAVAIGLSKEHGVYTTEKYTVAGYVLSVDSTVYGNLTIKDEAGNTLYIYGLWSADGSSRYDAMTNKPVGGDYIVVTGVIGCYSNQAQMKNGWMLEYEAHNHDYAAATCEDPQTCVYCGATTGAALGHIDENGDNSCDRCEINMGVSYVTSELSFSSKNNRTVFNTSQQVWAANGITLTNDKGSSTSNVADYASPARFYKSSKITVACSGMTEIVFVCNSASYATALKNSITANSNYTVTVSGSNVTVTFVEAVDTFVISSLSGGQVRVNSMKVTHIQ